MGSWDSARIVSGEGAQGNPVSMFVLQTLVLYECEKHPREEDWEEAHIGDRTCGILMQLISCLQCRRCPHYFLPAVDLFRGKSPSSLDNAANSHGGFSESCSPMA